MNKNNSPYSGIYLRSLRKSKGLRQVQVASMLGHKTVTRLGQFENGTRIPDLEVLVKLSKIYGTPFMEILGVYIDAHFDEIRSVRRAQSPGPKTDPPKVSVSTTDGCHYERLLKSIGTNTAAIRTVQRHAADLIRLAAVKLGHV